MHEQIIEADTPIRRGIKNVGVGKKGSKDLDPGLVHAILHDLIQGKISAAEKGAFFSGITFKGITPAEMALAEAFPPGTLTDPTKLARVLSADAPLFV